MTRYTLEISVGVFLAAGIAALFMLAMKVSNLSTTTLGNTYEVSVRFENIGGLSIRSPVKASGVLVGRVGKISYDMEDFTAEVTLNIQNEFDQFPSDSRASIYTAGILGEQYVEILPGIADTYLGNGSKIMLADSAMILEKLVGRIVTKLISD